MFAVGNRECRPGKSCSRDNYLPRPRTSAGKQDVIVLRTFTSKHILTIYVKTCCINFFCELEHGIRRPLELTELLQMRFVHTCDDSPLRPYDTRKLSDIPRIILAELEYENIFIAFEALYESRDAERRIVAIARCSNFFPFGKYGLQNLSHARLAEAPRDGDLYPTMRGKALPRARDNEPLDRPLYEGHREYRECQCEQYNKRCFKK